MVDRILFLTPDTIISGARDGGLIVWDVPSEARRHTLNEPDGTLKSDGLVALKVNANLLVSAHSGGAVRIWDLHNGHAIHNLQSDDGYVRSLEFNADGSLLATGSSEGEIKIWTTDSG